MISLQKIKKLPDSPGVYLFKGNLSKILYVGKATSLRSRVRSYFAGNILETRGQLVEQMVSIAKKVDFIKTDTVLEALILEANLIRKHKPHHNTKDKDDKSFNTVVITDEKFPRVLIVRGREVEQCGFDGSYVAIYGPFPNGGALREAMKIIRRIFPYRDHKCIPADDQPESKQPRPCFNKQIGLCPGICTGEISAKEYANTIKHLMTFFDGKKKQLLKNLEKEMHAFAKNKEFEKAARVKKTVFALQHIQDVALIKRDKDRSFSEADFRIESYDVAHLSGNSTVGVMTVVVNGEATPAEYRTFRIRQNSQGDDLKALGELLTRRFSHPEWAMPALIVIDGGTTHLHFAIDFLNNLKIRIPVVSVVKNTNHTSREVLTENESSGVVAHERQAEIFLANSEAHRFAIKYHKNLRAKNFLQ